LRAIFRVDIIKESTFFEYVDVMLRQAQKPTQSDVAGASAEDLKKLLDNMKKEKK
jgi:hypothetical protein